MKKERLLQINAQVFHLLDFSSHIGRKYSYITLLCEKKGLHQPRNIKTKKIFLNKPIFMEDESTQTTNC